MAVCANWGGPFCGCPCNGSSTIFVSVLGPKCPQKHGMGSRCRIAVLGIVMSWGVGSMLHIWPKASTCPNMFLDIN